MHPACLFLFFAFAFVFCLCVSHPAALAAVLTCGAIYFVKIAGKSAKKYLLQCILPLVLLVTVVNGFVNHYGVTVLFVMRSGNNFTLEALVCGLVTALRIAGMLLWLECFNAVITSDEIIFLFGRVSPRTALILSMVLRFIPLLREQSAEIIKAEKGIGNGVQAVTIVNKIKTVSRRLSVLVSWTLEKGIDTADAMKARGYGLAGRTFYHSYVFTGCDAALAASATTATVLTFIFNERYAASYNPVIAVAKPDVFCILMLLFFLGLLLFPVLYDRKEEKIWTVSE